MSSYQDIRYDGYPSTAGLSRSEMPQFPDVGIKDSTEDDSDIGNLPQSEDEACTIPFLGRRIPKKTKQIIQQKNGDVGVLLVNTTIEGIGSPQGVGILIKRKKKI